MAGCTGLGNDEHTDRVRAEPGLNAATRRYITLWVLIAVALTAKVTWCVPIRTETWLPVLALTLLVALAERVQLDFSFESETGVYTLIEVALTAALLLVGPLPAVLAAILGTTLAQVARRSTAAKTVFAAAQAGAGMGAAALVLLLVPTVGPLVAGRPVLGAVAGMIVYVVINLGSMIGLLSRAGGAGARDIIRSQVPLTASMMVGQVATGIVFAVLVETDPWLAPFVLAPAAAVYLAARGALRSADLLTRVQAQRDQLTRIIDGASDGILLLDESGAVQVWNPAMTRMTGLGDEQVVGQPVAAVLSDRVRAADQPVRGRWLVDEAHTGATMRELDAQLTHLDGTRRAVHESHSLVFDDRGRCTGDVVVVRDVTRQQQLERLRSDFVARISHELRSPLTPIRGFVDVLLRRGEKLSAEQRTQTLERILERAEHLGALVEDLLMVTHLDEGDLGDLVQPVPVQLEDTVTTAVDRVRRRAPHRQISTHISSSTPTALADANRVTQIIDALLDNACRYTAKGTPIEITLDHEGDDVRIRVTDHGPGIPRDQHAAIFEPFHRLEDPLTMRTSGVGLGLFISRQLATAMSGTLQLADDADEHAIGVGTTFVLRLPTADAVDGPSTENG